MELHFRRIAFVSFDPPGSFGVVFAQFKNRSAVAVNPSFNHATPTTSDSGAGENGISFSRTPDVHVRDCVATAMPAPASTDAIRLLTLSCSSTMRGFAFAAAN